MNSMRLGKFVLLFFILPLCAFTGIHKYYISVTQINYIEEKQSIQITSKVFIDDFERLLQERYDENIILGGTNEAEKTNEYIGRYLKEKLKIKVNDKEVVCYFLGKEYDADIMTCYLEVEGVPFIKTIEVKNKVLFDVFSDQQNIVKTKINSAENSFMLHSQKDLFVLKFD